MRVRCGASGLARSEARGSMGATVSSRVAVKVKPSESAIVSTEARAYVEADEEKYASK